MGDLGRIYTDEEIEQIILEDRTERSPQFNYLTESARTASGKFYGKHVDFNRFTECLTQFMVAANNLDRYKKLLFYGPSPEKSRFADPPNGNKDGYSITETFSYDNESEIKARYILHGILGIMTEAGELAELLHQTIVGNLPTGSGGLDEVNLKEEIGDLQWYEAMLARALGTDFDAIQRLNIAKLKARFPEKFTEANANERDLQKEREILEGSVDNNILAAK